MWSINIDRIGYLTILSLQEGSDGGRVHGVTVFNQICLVISKKWLKGCGITVLQGREMVYFFLVIRFSLAKILIPDPNFLLNLIPDPKLKNVVIPWQLFQGKYFKDYGFHGFQSCFQVPNCIFVPPGCFWYNRPYSRYGGHLEFYCSKNILWDAQGANTY